MGFSLDQPRIDRQLPGETLLRALGVDTVGPCDPLADHEWDTAILESVRQGVIPLLFRQVQIAASAGDVPAGVVARLRQLAVASAAKNLRLYRELTDVLGVLRRSGIDVIVLKGAYLAEAVYGDFALRPMTDIDLLVRKRDLEATESILMAGGYSHRRQPHRDEDYSGCQHLHPLTRGDGPPVEIHWTIESPTEPFEIDIDGLWERARPARVAGVDVLVLSPEDLLLHLCLHTSFHHRLALGLRGCWDILETIRREKATIDWGQMERRARGWRAAKYVYLMLRLAKDLLGTPVPEPVLAGLTPGGLDPRVIQLARTEVLGQASERSVAAPFARVSGSTRILEKVRWLARAVFPSRKVLGRIYPASRSLRTPYPYYLLRWHDLIRRSGMAVWCMVRRDEGFEAMIRREHERDVLMEWLKPASL